MKQLSSSSKIAHWDVGRESCGPRDWHAWGNAEPSHGVGLPGSRSTWGLWLSIHCSLHQTGVF